MTQSSRRTFLKSSAIGVAAVAGSQAMAQSSAPSPSALAQVGALEASKLLATTANWNDGLAHPIPYKPMLGLGKERGLAFGGGGIVLISWYVGYFHALKTQGLEMNNTNIVVGTSAGSLFGSMLMNGNVWRITKELDLFKDFPNILAKLVPETQFNESQMRAKKIATTVKDASLESIQSLGRASMAARNSTGEGQYKKTVEDLIGVTTWPSKDLYITAMDCYTGERLVVSQSSNIAASIACAASSSLAGGAGPTFLKDRLCMDGGMCQTSTHTDVIAGVKKAVVFSLGDGTREEVKRNLKTTNFPDTLLQEIASLKAQGTKTMHIIAGLPPGMTKIDSVMDPNLIAPFMKYGFDRGMAEAAKLKEFWA